MRVLPTMLGFKKQPVVRSVIAEGMRVCGDCVFEGSLQIDGMVVGHVLAQGAESSVLIVGQTGSVEGDVCADQVLIAGTVIGNVQARDLLQLSDNARINGDVSYDVLEMASGASVVGQLQPRLTRLSPSISAPPSPVLSGEQHEPTLDPK